MSKATAMTAAMMRFGDFKRIQGAPGEVWCQVHPCAQPRLLSIGECLKAAEKRLRAYSKQLSGQASVNSAAQAALAWSVFGAKDSARKAAVWVLRSSIHSALSSNNLQLRI